MSSNSKHLKIEPLSSSDLPNVDHLIGGDNKKSSRNVRDLKGFSFTKENEATITELAINSGIEDVDAFLNRLSSFVSINQTSLKMDTVKRSERSSKVKIREQAKTFKNAMSRVKSRYLMLQKESRRDISVVITRTTQALGIDGFDETKLLQLMTVLENFEDYSPHNNISSNEHQNTRRLTERLYKLWWTFRKDGEPIRGNKDRFSRLLRIVLKVTRQEKSDLRYLLQPLEQQKANF